MSIKYDFFLYQATLDVTHPIDIVYNIIIAPIPFFKNHKTPHLNIHIENIHQHFAAFSFETGT